MLTALVRKYLLLLLLLLGRGWLLRGTVRTRLVAGVGIILGGGSGDSGATGSRGGSHIVSGPAALRFGGLAGRFVAGGGVHGGISQRAFGGKSTALLLQIQNGPVKHVVVLKALAVKQFLEQALEVGVVRTIFES